jgi:PD-(D/E)XK nuclease superfamily
MPEHRPYARDRNAPPSVTQVVGTLDKPGLSWGAAKETAAYAVHHMAAWSDLPSDRAVSILYRHHRGVWDHRALVGSAIHEVNAQWCQGNSVRVLDIIQGIRERSRLWQEMPEDQLYSELLPMADGLSRFWTEAKPVPLSWEQVVRYRAGNPDLAYIGTLDWRAEINGQPLILDLKTTGSVKHGQGKYWDQWRLQLAAYRYATEAVLYREHTEVGTFELPEVAGAAVVHLYKDGKVEFNPVKAGPREHEVFLALRRVYGWRQGEGQGMGNVDMTPALGSAS